MKVLTDIVYNNKGQRLDLYLPDSAFDCVFVFFHGGGLEAGSKDPMPVFAPYLLERNIAVISADYRMYPNAKFPEFIEDSADAVAWAFRHIREYGNCNRLFVGGSSAGGYLSMMLCFNPHWLENVGVDPAAVAGYIHDAGQPTSHFNVLREQGLDTRRVIVDETAPLYYVGLQESYRPMLFLVSDDDMTNRYEQTVLMLSTLKHFGHDIAESRVLHGTHCQHDNTLDENGDSVFGKLIFDFISRHI